VRSFSLLPESGYPCLLDDTVAVSVLHVARRDNTTDRKVQRQYDSSLLGVTSEAGEGTDVVVQVPAQGAMGCCH
jgi:hypothetical protein